MTGTSKIGIAVLTATLIAGSLVPARAQSTPSVDGADMVQTTIPFGDLDLASPSGQARARQRLAVAIHAACGDADADREAAAATCQDEALVDTRAQLTTLILRARAPRIQMAAR